MNFIKKKTLSNSWLRLAILIPIISFINVSCKETSYRDQDIPPQLLPEVATLISPFSKAQIDNFAFALHSYVKIQSKLKGKSADVVDQAFRQRMEMQGTVSKATIMEVSEIAKALLPVRGNSSSRLITNGQPVVNSSSSQEAEASSDNLSSGVQSAINFTTNALNSVAGPSESVSPDDFSMVGRLQNQINIAASNAQSIYHNGGMTQEELTVTLEAMYGAQANLEAIYHFITFNYNAMEDGTAEVEGYPSSRRGAC